MLRAAPGATNFRAAGRDWVSRRDGVSPRLSPTTTQRRGADAVPRDPRYDVLFEPVRIGPVTARNRFYQVPRCTGMGHTMPRSLAAMREVNAAGDVPFRRERVVVDVGGH